MSTVRITIALLGCMALLGGPTATGYLASTDSTDAPQRGTPSLKLRKGIDAQRRLSPPPAQIGSEVEPPPPAQPPGNLQRLNRQRLLRALDLTRDQLVLARQIQQRYGPKMQQLHDQLEELQDAFHQAIFSEPYDAQLVEQRLQQVLQKQQELMRAQVEQEREFRELLTPQQLEKFRALQARQMEIRRLHRALRDQQRQLDQEVKTTDRP